MGIGNFFQYFPHAPSLPLCPLLRFEFCPKPHLKIVWKAASKQQPFPMLQTMKQGERGEKKQRVPKERYGMLLLISTDICSVL